MGIEPRTTLRLSAIGISLFLVCAFAVSTMAADLKIGLNLSLTGGTDDAGKGARMGAELALAEYNERGGYKGQKVAAVIYDDETKPAKGVENVTRLITRDKVFAIFGPINSGVALAIIDIVQKNQIPLMDPAATADRSSSAIRPRRRATFFAFRSTTASRRRS
jgi:branched-chain amino acid transport system substrate-binding protein